MNGGIRIASLLVLIGLALIGCATIGEETKRAAREAVLAVRPDVDLAEVDIGVLSFWNDPRHALSRLDTDLARHRREIYEEAIGVLARAKLLDDADLAKLDEYFVEIDVVGHSGLTIMALGSIYLHPDRADDVSTLGHELAHVATHRKGYSDNRNERYFLRPGGNPDPRFFDLDAFLADKILCESDAEITERIAMAYRKGHDAAVDAFWRQTFPADPPDVTGPAEVVYSEGTRVLKAGETMHLPRNLLGSFQTIAYHGSLALVQARHRDGEPLEQTLARTWSDYSYQTKEVLFPRQETSRSRLAPVARHLAGEATGALRAGAFLVWELLKNRSGLERDEATALTSKLEDDLIVRTRKTDFCWVTVWADEDAARQFAELYREILGEGSVVADSRRTVATVGDAVYERNLFED